MAIFFAFSYEKTYTAASISAARPLITERSCNRSCIERVGSAACPLRRLQKHANASFLSVKSVISLFAIFTSLIFGNIIERNEIQKWSVCKISTKCLEFSCKRAQSRTCSGYAERSRKSQRRGTTPKDRFPVTHSDTKILLLFHQSQTNVIAFFLSAQSVILPFAIFTLLLFRKF